MTVFKVNFKGWEKDYYFSTFELARTFVVKYLDYGYKNYNIEPISIREAI